MKRIVCLLAWWGTSLLAPAMAGTGIEAQDSKQIAESERAKSFFEQDYLTGDWGGTRTRLEDKGVHFGAIYIGETLANVSGGTRQEEIYEGRLQLEMALDFEKLAGLKGGSFYVSAYEIHGNDLSGGALGNIMTASNIEAYDTFRLFDLWYQQEFLDGKVSVRFGQLAADDEFFISEYGSTFINGTFGWPALMGSNLYSGGPAYPMATPGVRVKVDPTEQISLMAAVFDGDPGDSFGTDNPQKRNSSGTRVDFNQGAFSIFEAAYKLNQEKDAKGLPGTYKLGGYFDTYHTADVNQSGLDDFGLLTGPVSQHRDNYGVYFVADQMIWRKPSDKSEKVNPDVRTASEGAEEPSKQGVGLFWRVGGAPSDRNPVEFYTDGGFNLVGLIPGREDDIFGFGVGFAKISGDQIDAEHENNRVSGTNRPASDYELLFEWTYQIALAPWWTLQPDIQYIVHPGGGNITDPDDAAGEIAAKDAVVLGLRTSITF